MLKRDLYLEGLKIKMKNAFGLLMLLFLMNSVVAQPNSTHWTNINATQDTWVGVGYGSDNITNQNYTYDSNLHLHRWSALYPSYNWTSFAYMTFNVPSYMHDVYFTGFFYAHNVNTIHDIYISIWEITDLSNFTFTWNTQPCDPCGGVSGFGCGATLLVNYSMVGVGVGGVGNTRQNISISDYMENLDGDISLLIGISQEDTWSNGSHQLLQTYSIESNKRPTLWFQVMNCTLDIDCGVGFFCNDDDQCEEYFPPSNITGSNITVNVFYGTNPVPDALVTLYDLFSDYESSGYTNDSGVKSFLGLNDSTYRIYVTKTGFETGYKTIYLDDEWQNVTINLEVAFGEVCLNFTTYDAVNHSVIAVPQIDMIYYTIQDDGGIDYPDGEFLFLGGGYTGDDGKFDSCYDDITKTFGLGFLKEGYNEPLYPSTNFKSITLLDSWYDSESGNYYIPYFDFYMSRDVGDYLNMTVLVRDSNGYIRLPNVTVDVITPNSLYLSDTTDINGYAYFEDVTGCWQITASKQYYATEINTVCPQNVDYYLHEMTLIREQVNATLNVTTYNISGYIFDIGSNPIPMAMVNLDCEIKCQTTGNILYSKTDMYQTNVSGYYEFRSILENAECDVIASHSEYNEESNFTIMYQDWENFNLTLEYIGKRYSVDGTLTRCWIAGLPQQTITNAFIELYFCGDTTNICNQTSSTQTDSYGRFNFTGLATGYYKFKYTKNGYEDVTDTEYITKDKTLFPCIYPTKPLWWLKGVVLEQYEDDAGSILQRYVDRAVVKVYDTSDNSLEIEMTTGTSGRFAFKVKDGRYRVVASEGGREAMATIYLDEDFKTDQLKLVLSIGRTVSRKFQEEEFIDTLYTLLPNIIILFIIFMVINAIKNVTR